MENFIFLIPIIILILTGFFIVKQQTIAVVERLGKFKKDYGPGF